MNDEIRNEGLKRLLDAKHGVSPEAVRALPDDAVGELRVLARSGVPQALEMLVAVHPREAAELARGTARNSADREPASLALAARVLGQVDGADAEADLIELAALGHPTVAAAALRELAAVGSPRCLETVARWQRSQEIPALATLAAALVAFRAGVPGFEPELPAARREDVVRFDQQIEHGPLAPEEAQAIAAQVRSFGADLSARGAQQFVCRGLPLVALLDAAVVQGDEVAVPAGRRLVAVIASQAPVDQSWSTALLALAWPDGDGQAIGVFRTDGRPVYGGRIDGSGRFDVSGLVGGGPFAVSVQGRARGELTIDEARSGTTDQRAATPEPTPPGA